MRLEKLDGNGADRWEDLSSRDVDGETVQFARPADTGQATWALYRSGEYLGTVSADRDGGRLLWRVHATNETHETLDDAVRALRRPVSWQHERDQAARWARVLLADSSLLIADVESTGLEGSYAVQIAAVDRQGDVVFSEYVQPNAPIEPTASSVHGITSHQVRQAATFSQLLPRLTRTFHGHAVVAYNAAIDRGVFERELRRHFGGTASAAQDWLGGIRWHEAMTPYAVWRGLWSVERGAYRSQPLGGPHDAVADARLLLMRLKTMAESASTPGTAEVGGELVQR
ncbi:3'-5' exonuclease [Streptomyces sp. NPDC055085]